MNRYPTGLAAIGILATSLAAQAAQQVFIDFDTATAADEYQYTQAERDEVLTRMEADYARFDLVFSQSPFASGPFSTITINDGPALGLADDIDFRNLNPSDNATVNVNPSLARTSEEYVTLTANIASHELGHILGLRHADSFGPIGSGIDPQTASAFDFEPVYPGPQNANQTRFHLMESDGDITVEIVTDQFFGARSAIKLAFNEEGRVISESSGSKGSLATAQHVEMGGLLTPNTLTTGPRAGLGDFDVDALAVTGTLESGQEVDLYAFGAEAGDLFSFEVMSGSTTRIREGLNGAIDPTITILDASGNAIDYYGSTAFSDDNYEPREPLLLDVVIPETGTYYARVASFSPADTGSYELFFHRFNGVAVPEPTALLTLIVSALVGRPGSRRRTA